MSFNPLTALRALRDRQDLSPGEFGVMVAIVLRADSHGSMWASQTLLAKDCKLSGRSVRHKLTSLEEKGLIKRIRRAGTSDYTSINRKALTLAESSTPVLTLAESSYPPGRIFLPPRQDFPTPPEESSAYLPNELPNDLPNELPKLEKEILRAPKADFSGIWENLNSIMDRTGGSCLKLTKKRREALSARIKEHGQETLISVVEWYHGSSHPRAVFLRTNGYTIDTVLQRSKFDQYVTMSELPEGSVIETKDPLSVLGAARKLRLKEGL